MKQRELGTKAPEDVKVAISQLERGANSLVKTFPGKDTPLLDVFGHAPKHPLAEPYLSQAALHYGDPVAKVAAFPVAPARETLAEQVLDTGPDPDVFRHAVAAFFRGEEAAFEIRVQFCTDLAAMPVEDASQEWSRTASPDRTVTRLTLPAQTADGAARLAYADDALSYRSAR